MVFEAERGRMRNIDNNDSESESKMDIEKRWKICGVETNVYNPTNR